MRAVVAAVLGDEELKRRVDSVSAPGEAGGTEDGERSAADATAEPAGGGDELPSIADGEAAIVPHAAPPRPADDPSLAAGPPEQAAALLPVSGGAGAPDLRSWTGVAPPIASASPIDPITPPDDTVSGRPAPAVRLRRRRSSALLPGLLAPADIPEDAPGRVEFIVPTVPPEESAEPTTTAAAPDVTVSPNGTGDDRPGPQEVSAVQPPRSASDPVLWLPVAVLALILLVIFVLGMTLTH